MLNGEYITFVDSDDFIECNTLKTIDDIIKDTNCDLIKYSYYKNCSNYKIEYKFSIKTNTVISREDYPTMVYPYTFKTFDLSCVWNCFIKREALGNILFEENLKYAEDFKFMCDLINGSQNFFLCDKPLYHYTYNPCSAINTFNEQTNLKKLKDNIYVMNYIRQLFNIEEMLCIEKRKDIIARHILDCMYRNYREYKKILNHLVEYKITDSSEYKYYAKIMQYYRFRVGKAKRNIKNRLKKILVK